MVFILAGGGLGALILAPVIRTLLSSVGGRWTLRIYTPPSASSPVFLSPWAVPQSRLSSISSPDQEPERRKTHVSRTLALRAAFLFSAIAAFLQAARAQPPLSFIPSYTITPGLKASDGANLLAASNAINSVSRVLAGYAGDRLGRQNTLVMTLFLAASGVFTIWLSSALTMAGPSVSVPPLWLAFIVMYSFSAGGYYALFPSLIAEVFGIRQYAAVNAFVLFVRGLGTMFGSPVGGGGSAFGGDGEGDEGVYGCGVLGWGVVGGRDGVLCWGEVGGYEGEGAEVGCLKRGL
ncbi:major facilitator superfamily domain-containing protein [Immersiella caudata]|uniref:Major facilitator superfamily domain-containing protein n=1 Tax=Immersiella caudata TaxID=314043 RepID=A0AA39XCH9_9PEZI|nr:major facilitator superfamily domain-containing protein [Immersiella caudata]